MRSSDHTLLDTRMRSAADVLQDHLRLREAAELEEDLRRNYAPDVVLLSARGVLRGHEGVRASAAFLYEAGAGHEYTRQGAGVELHVGDPATLVPALPDGHLRVVWDGRSGDSPAAPERARYLLGGVVLLALLALALTAARADGLPRI